MKTYEATEQAYKNGYEKGKQDAVKHGRWEVVHGVLTPGGDPLLRCNICRARESEHLCGIEFRTIWNYCPNCGAKMDLKKDTDKPITDQTQAALEAMGRKAHGEE